MKEFVLENLEWLLIISAIIYVIYMALEGVTDNGISKFMINVAYIENPMFNIHYYTDEGVHIIYNRIKREYHMLTKEGDLSIITVFGKNFRFILSRIVDSDGNIIAAETTTMSVKYNKNTEYKTISYLKCDYEGVVYETVYDRYNRPLVTAASTGNRLKFEYNELYDDKYANSERYVIGNKAFPDPPIVDTLNGFNRATTLSKFKFDDNFVYGTATMIAKDDEDDMTISTIEFDKDFRVLSIEYKDKDDDSVTMKDIFITDLQLKRNTRLGIFGIISGKHYRREYLTISEFPVKTKYDLNLLMLLAYPPSILKVIIDPCFKFRKHS